RLTVCGGGRPDTGVASGRPPRCVCVRCPASVNLCPDPHIDHGPERARGERVANRASRDTFPWSMPMYQWLVFSHVLRVFGFRLAPGASAAVAFKLRGEREIARVRALLDLSRGAAAVGNVSLLVLLAAGIAAGFGGGWWGRGWIWAALGLLVLISFAMTG